MLGVLIFTALEGATLLNSSDRAASELRDTNTASERNVLAAYHEVAAYSESYLTPIVLAAIAAFIDQFLHAATTFE